MPLLMQGLTDDDIGEDAEDEDEDDGHIGPGLVFEPATQPAGLLFFQAFVHGRIELVDIGLHVPRIFYLLKAFYGVVEEFVPGHGAFDGMELFAGQFPAEIVHQLLIVDVLVAIG